MDATTANLSQVPPDAVLTRIIPLQDATDEARNWLRQRVAHCLARSWPHVAPLREARWSDDGSAVTLVYDMPGERLGDYLVPLTETQRAKAVQCLAEQLLLALCSLHADGMFHGDLCADAIYVVRRDDGEIEVQIAHLPTGGLAAKLGQALVPDVPCNQPAYWPPEALKVRPEPHPLADQYALGILLLEAVGGREAIKHWNQRLDKDPHQRLATVWPKKAERNHGSVRRLIESLVAEKQQRPSARNAYASWLVDNSKSSWERFVPGRWLIIGIAVLGVSLLLVLFAWQSARWEIEKLTGDIKQLETKTTNLEGENNTLKEAAETHGSKVADLEQQVRAKDTAISTLQDENESLRGGKGELPPRSPQEIAEGFWSAQQRNGEVSQGDLEKLAEVDQKAAELVRHWMNERRRLKINAKPWGNGDNDLASALKEAEHRPWKAIAKIRERLANLNKAVEVWKSALKADSAENFERVIHLAGGHGEAVKNILSKWYSEILDKNYWTIRVTKGIAPNDAGTTREIRFQTAQDTKDAEAHDWSAPNLHAYDPPLEFTVRWKPGEPVTVVLYGERSTLLGGARSTLLSGTYGGPMAMLRLYQNEGIGGEGSSLYWEVLNCPGPPGDVLKPVPIKVP